MASREGHRIYGEFMRRLLSPQENGHLDVIAP